MRAVLYFYLFMFWWEVRNFIDYWKTKHLENKRVNKRGCFLYPRYKSVKSFGVLSQSVSWFVALSSDMCDLELFEGLQPRVDPASTALSDTTHAPITQVSIALVQCQNRCPLVSSSSWQASQVASSKTPRWQRFTLVGSILRHALQVKVLSLGWDVKTPDCTPEEVLRLVSGCSTCVGLGREGECNFVGATDCENASRCVSPDLTVSGMTTAVGDAWATALMKISFPTCESIFSFQPDSLLSFFLESMKSFHLWSTYQIS